MLLSREIKTSLTDGEILENWNSVIFHSFWNLKMFKCESEVSTNLFTAEKKFFCRLVLYY